ncbi:MAG: HAD family hydrolase [Spirochaetia bacterium]
MSTGWIFDFDGVLVNTMEGHFSCYGQALAEAGIPIDRARFFSQAGMTGREQIRYFAQQAGKLVDPEAVYRRKNEIFREMNPPAERIECMVELLHALRAAGQRVAIATGSSRASVLPVIAQHRLEPDALVTSEDVRQGKPHPDLFLLAAQRLHLAPAECVVIEDSDVGIEAAKRGGMRALRFYDLPAAGAP